MDLSQAHERLSEQLRVRTAGAHLRAESSPYMTALVAGRVNRLGLAALLSRLLPVYAVLESLASSWAEHPIVGELLLPELDRSERLAADLRHLTGCADVQLTEASQAYASRVAEVGRSSAAGFLAHHYTRSLGDLSGGQVIRAALQRSLGVVDGAGASFFAFPGVRPGAVKKQYRRLLDEMPFPASQRARLIEEVLEAYRLNEALVAELDADLTQWTAT